MLVAGVGYRNLRDMSMGPLLVDKLRTMQWPRGVEVEDLSFGAVHVLHWLQEHPERFRAAVFVASVKRGRQPGAITCERWRAPETSAKAVQERIAEAVTGVINLDTLLVVLAYFHALPENVMLVEIEPRDEDWGSELSAPVAAAADEAIRLIRSEVGLLQSAYVRH